MFDDERGGSRELGDGYMVTKVAKLGVVYKRKVQVKKSSRTRCLRRVEPLTVIAAIKIPPGVNPCGRTVNFAVTTRESVIKPKTCF